MYICVLNSLVGGWSMRFVSTLQSAYIDSGSPVLYIDIYIHTVPHLVFAIYRFIDTTYTSLTNTPEIIYIYLIYLYKYVLQIYI